MKIRFDAEIKPGEWLAIATFLIIFTLLCAGKVETAIAVLHHWMVQIRK